MDDQGAWRGDEGLVHAARAHAARARLTFVLLAGLLTQILIRLQDWTADPLSRVPRVDAAHNWSWAGRIAAGEWVGDAPFFGAPLLPYVAGVLRAVGGDLLALVILQTLLLLLGALLLGKAARNLTSAPWAPALAAASVLFTTEVAHASGRVLSSTLQVVLVCWVLERASSLARRAGTGGAWSLGLAIGITVLAWPTMLAPGLALALWAMLVGSRASGLLTLAGMMLCIAPATVHNALASGEWIPVSAHAGVTFFHGNNPGADGTLTGSGLSMDKSVHQREALEETREALGPDAGWGDVSGHFLSKGLAWWRAEPARAVGLAARKAVLFAGARHYGDIDLVTLERSAVLPTLWLAPIPAAWLAAAGVLLALASLRAKRIDAWPAALVALAAFGVVVVFWYSPRYRLPAVPASGLLIACAWARAGSSRLVLTGLAAGLLATLTSSLTGWDSAARLEPGFRLALARAYGELGLIDHAKEQALAASELGDRGAGIYLAELEGGALGLEALRALSAERPRDAELARRLAVMLAGAGELDEAEAAFERAASLDPLDWRALQGWGAARLQGGRPQEAIVPLERALELAPSEPDVLYTRGLAAEGVGEFGLARTLAERSLQVAPGHFPSRDLLVRSLRQVGDDGALLSLLSPWIEEEPDSWPIRVLAAWVLSTTPTTDLADGSRALELLAGWPHAADDADALDTLAAAHAAAGEWEQAVRLAEQAVELASDWPEEARGPLEERLVAHRAKQRWTEPR